MSTKPGLFDFAAEVGLTKHVGGLQTTDELARQCKIAAGSYVLDVGCGVGATACYLAQKLGCRVVGVDLLPRMIERCIERAERLGCSDRLEFRQADVQDLPFEAGLFDAVISESVMVFPADKLQALREVVRVTRPGGFVGLNEAVWQIESPPPEVADWVRQDLGADASPLSCEAWVQLMHMAGLAEISARVYPIHVASEARAILQRYGLGEMLGVMSRTLRLYSRSSQYREFVREIRQGDTIPKNLGTYLGYGLFVGRK